MKILIIRFSALGDLVTLEKTFRAIRYFFKNADITFLTSKIGKELYEDSGYFDKYVVMNNRKELINILKELKGEKFDMVFDLHCNTPSHIINMFVGKKRNICMSRTFFQKLFNLKHRGKTLKEMLILSGIDKKKVENYFKDPLNSKVKLKFKENEKIKNLLKEKFGNKKIIVIGIGASEKWESKKWGVENYKKLIKELIKEYGVVLVGSELEKKEGEEIEKEIPEVLNLIAKTSIQELKTVIGYGDVFIGNDSGPTQIAAGIGIKTVAIFGPTAKEHLSKKNFQNIYHITPGENIKCHPCYESVCPYEHECMKDITPKRVLNLIKEIT